MRVASIAPEASGRRVASTAAPPHPVSPSELRHWNARLEVAVASRGAASIAVHRRHEGPLRLQKPLYPEGPGVAHLLVVHPPAGIAGGDRLAIDVDVRDAAHALVTTPGATKWYRSDGAVARQDATLAVAAGACLEWLPQENIVFDGADVATSTAIACGSGATCIGREIVVLGRLASGERFTRGALRQDLSLAVDGRVVWRERGRLAAADPLVRSAVGWHGRRVAGLFWAFGRTLPDDDLERCRDVTRTRPDASITRLAEGLVVGRVLSDSAEQVRELFDRLWTVVRPALTMRTATPPRIWAT